jgi:hypothetical protein
MAISPINSPRCCSKYVFSRVPATDVERCWDAIFFKVSGCLVLMVTAVVGGVGGQDSMRRDADLDGGGADSPTGWFEDP